MKKVCRYVITYTRSIIELHVCLYAFFEGYMLIIYGACLRKVFGILLRHWHMLDAHIRCMVEAYTWYMILVVCYFV
jgi:hypothetical protein